MNEKLVIGFIGIVTALLVTIALADVFGDVAESSGAATDSTTATDVTDSKEQSTGNNVEVSAEDNQDSEDNGDAGEDKDNADNTDNTDNTGEIINISGTTLAARINAPVGYSRIEAEPDSLTDFMRNYSLKEDGAPVLLYDGSAKENRDTGIAVINLPLEARDLQHGADSVIRVYSEYFLSTGQYDRMKFKYSSGFEADYSKWIQGYKISIKNGEASWVKSEKSDDSYESFQEYMRMVYAYAGVWSMKQETTEIDIADIQVGDIFLDTTGDGHAVMVVDVCVNEAGEKAFLLAQGNSPAQEFEVLVNPLHDNDPWYYTNEIVYPLKTPEYTFNEGTLRRLSY